CLRVAGATIRTGRGAIGVDTDHLGFDIRDVIQAGDRKAGIDRRHARPHPECISTEISKDASLEAYNPAITPGGEFDILDLVASMRGGDELSAASSLPGAGGAGAQGEERENDSLAIKAELGAKSAANVRSDEPQLVQGQSEALA